MFKNTAGQSIGAQMITAADGSAFTGSVTVAVTGDSGTQATGSVGSGACAHEGGGYHSYRPAQAETNYDHIAFTFSGTGAIPVTVQVFTRAGDAFVRLGAPAGASVSADIAAVKAQTAAIEADTQDLQTQVGTDGAGLTNLPWNASWDAEVQSECTDALNAYDPPTNTEMVARTLAAADYATAANLATVAGYLDTEIAAILADTNELQTDWANGGRLDLILDARASQTSVDTIDDLLDTEIGALTTELAKVPKSDGTATWNATALGSIQQQAEDALVAHDAPTNTDLDARTLAAASYATAAAQATAQGTLDKLDDTLEDDGGTFRFTANALEEAPAGGGGGGDATEAKQDAIIALIGTPAVDLAADLAAVKSDTGATKAVTDQLADTLEDQGGGTYGFTEAALQEAPTGEGGGGTDWDADERTAIRAILGIPASGTTPDDPSTGILDTIRDAVGTRASQSSVDDLPTNAELVTALGTADDAVLAAIAGLNNLSSAQAQTAAAAALTAYDPPTRAEATADKDEVLAAVGGVPTAGENADAVLDEAVEGTVTLRQSVRLANAVLAGKASGLETTEATFRDLADTKDRVVATVDVDGNRTAVTRDLT